MKVYCSLKKKISIVFEINLALNDILFDNLERKKERERVKKRNQIVYDTATNNNNETCLIDNEIDLPFRYISWKLI